MEKNLCYVLKEQKMTLGRMKGKKVFVARPTQRKRVRLNVAKKADRKGNGFIRITYFLYSINDI